jgi:hypothetical protein
MFFQVSDVVESDKELSPGWVPSLQVIIGLNVNPSLSVALPDRWCC